MKFHNYERADMFEVREWLENSIVELTPYQREKIRDNEIIRFAPFEFYKKRKRVDNFWLRLTIVAIPLVTVLIAISMPFNFLLTGYWGYKYEQLKWYSSWCNSVGL